MSDAALHPSLTAGSEPPSRYRFGDFVLDAIRRALTRHGQPVALSSTQFDVMLYLVRHPDRVVTKDELLSAVWPTKTVEEGNVSQTIFTLRKALAEAGAEDEIIGTAHGRGYRLVAPVQSFGAPTEAPAPAPAVKVAAAPVAAARRRPRWALGAGVGAVVVVGALAVSLAGLRPGPPPPPIPVVVADFQNQTGDPVFDAVLQRAVRIDLAESPRMKVLTPATVASTLELMTRPRDTPLTPALAGEVCTRNGGRAVVEGAIARLGGRYLVTLSAVDCAGARTFGEAKELAADRDAVIPAIDRLSAKIRAKLGEAKASIDQFSAPLMPERTASIDALKALTLANALSVKGLDAEAIPYFERAIALDPNFARAYAGAAASYNNLGQQAKQVAYIRKAYALRGDVDPSLALNIEILYASEATNDYDEVIRASTLMGRLYPSAVSAFVNLANAENWIGHPEAAIAPARQAVAMAPKNSPGYFILALALMQADRPGEAAGVLKTAEAVGLTDNGLDAMRFQVAVARGDEAAAEQLLTKTLAGPAPSAILGVAAANANRLGQVTRAEAYYRRMAEYAAAQKSDDNTRLEQARELFALGKTADAKRVLATASEAWDPMGYLLAEAEFGDPAAARATLDRQLAASPSDTLLHALYAPQTRATLALRAGQPAAAIAALQASTADERHDTEIAYARANAYLAARDGARAAAEFRKITDHPGLEPCSPHHALALIGLGRALKLQGDVAGSRRAYESFLRLWAHADPDVPVLAQAKAEYAALGR